MKLFRKLPKAIQAGLIVLVIGAVGACQAICPKVVHADVSDDFSNSVMSGGILDGDAKAIIENVFIFSPDDEYQFGKQLIWGRYKLVAFDGIDVVDDVLMLANVGVSKRFKIFGRVMDEPFDMLAGGIYYDFARHWWGDDAPPVHLGFGIMEDGNALYTMYFDYDLNRLFGESLNGYSVGGDILIGMENLTNPDWRDFKFWFQKDTDPEGLSFIQAYVYNIAGKTTGGFGAGYTF